MPEGPEIRRVAVRLEKVLTGREAEDVYFEQAPLRRFAPILRGARVVAVTSRGKALLTQFDNERWLYSHNQLYGRWYVVRRGTMPSTGRTLRAAIHTARHSALLYSASDIAVLDADGVASHPYLAKLGPDALDASVEWRQIAERLRDPEFRGRSLAALYLDQGFVAGIGNYLRSEILFDARVHPSRKPGDLGRGEIGRLARSTLAMTRRAFDTAGVTNGPARVRALKARGLPRRRYRFAVFERGAEPCYECGAEIRRISANSRRLYFCPVCQPLPTAKRENAGLPG